MDVFFEHDHKIFLRPVSQGKNLGCGAATSCLSGSVVLDLGHMKLILEFG
jgi:hypothetical protein